MGKLWVVFFIVGSLFGRGLHAWPLMTLLEVVEGADTIAYLTGSLVLLGSAWLALTPGSSGGLRAFASGLLVAVAAFAWGFIHSAPAFDRGDGSMQGVAGGTVLASPEGRPNGLGLGLAAGTVRAAPGPGGDGSVQALAGGTLLGTPGPLLVVSHGRLFESYGSERFGPLGRVQVRAGQQAGLFARRSSHFSGSGAAVEPSGVVARALVDARGWLQLRFGLQRTLACGWLGAILLGNKAALAPRLRAAFKATGVYHLLIVSGLHVSLVVFCLSLVLQVPAHLAYSLRLVPADLWPAVQATVQVLIAALAVTYLVLAGCPVAAQRATIMFVLWQAARLFAGVAPLSRRLVFGTVLQTLIFPIGFIGEANLMTWGAYLHVLAAGRKRSATFSLGLRQALVLQCKILVLVAGVFGQVSIVGVAVNLLLVPLLGLLLGSALLLVCCPHLPGAALLQAFHQSFIESITLFHELSRVYPWLALAGEALPAWFRPAALLVSAWLLLNACRDLSISLEDYQ